MCGQVFFFRAGQVFFFLLPMWVKFFSFYVWVKFFFIFPLSGSSFFFLQKLPAPPMKSNGASLTWKNGYLKVHQSILEQLLNILELNHEEMPLDWLTDSSHLGYSCFNEVQCIHRTCWPHPTPVASNNCRSCNNWSYVGLKLDV